MRAECLCVPVLCAACCFMPSALLTRAKCASGIYQIWVHSCGVFALRDGSPALFSSDINLAGAHFWCCPDCLDHWKALANNWYFVSLRKIVNSYLAKAICTTRVWQKDSLNEVQVQKSQVPLERVIFSKELLNSRLYVSIWPSFGSVGWEQRDGVVKWWEF